MPWKKFKVEGGYKVWKLGADGNKVGNPLSNKPQSPEEADKQVAALYASEKKPKKEMLWSEPEQPELFISQSELKGKIVPPNPTSYTTTGSTIIATITDADGNTESKELKMMDEEMAYMPMGGACSWEEMEAHEEAQEMSEKMMDMNYKFRMMADNIIRNPMMEDKAGALVELANGYATRIKKPESDDKALDIAKQIAGDNQPVSKSQSDSTNDPGGDSGKATETQNLFIWKEGNTYRWLAAYSNNRRDDDNPPEIISSESHKEFDEALHKGEWPMPEAWLWHVPYPVGVTDYHAYDESAGFPIAAGHFYKGMEWAAEGILQAGWDGNSHGMPSEWIQRDKDDPTIITRHRTKEITFLPQWAAANKLAFNIISKETIMAEEKGLPAHKRDEFIKAFGEERVTQIEAALSDKAKEADDAGIEKKEATTPETLTPDNPVVKALEMVVTQLTALDARLKAIEEKQVEEKEQPFDLMEFLKGKSAVGQPTTKVDGRSTLAKDAPKETEPASLTQNETGVRVALVDQFVQANQAWYQEKN